LRTNSRRRAGLGAIAVAITLVGAACGSSKSSGGSSSSLSATLNGSGSSFQLTLEQSAIAAFTQKNSGVTINYAGGGSSKGKADLAGGIVDFAGSDSLVKPAELTNFKGAAFLYFPIAAAPITVSYNLAGVDKVQLSADTLAAIFDGSIKKWNDAKIAADNSGVTLPSTTIVVAHRAEGSGTTSNFTKFLEAASPNEWKLGHGDTVNWPASEQAGQGNSGVAQIVKDTNGAIGYVDFADAKNAGLSTASIKNAAGEFVAPSIDGASKAVAGAKVADDLTYNPINAAGSGVYPITAPTWVLVRTVQSDAAKGAAIKAYLDFLLTTGQTLAPTVNYAPLPADLASKAVAQLDKLQIAK
jgi:phosphate transport system substrate-binding protein